MIVRRSPGPIRLLFIFQGSILRSIASQVIALFAYAWLILYLQHRFNAELHPLVSAPVTLFGIAISVFLAFRNNACYDRWWEARKAWGALLIDTRSFARKVVTLLPDEHRQKRLVHGAIAFTWALNEYLRNAPSDHARRWFDPPATEGNVPEQILRNLATEIATAQREGQLTDILYAHLDDHLNAFANTQGACERIALTPTPFAYKLLLHRAVGLLCLLLPFGIGTSLGWAMPFFVVLVGYTLLGLDALADELERPFEPTPNELPLNAISRFIEISLLETLGETDLPKPVVPVGFHLD